MSLGFLPRLLRAKEPPAFKPYQRVRLIDQGGATIKASALAEGETYLFFYPYVGTPCFLINLGTPREGRTLQTASGLVYAWPGGVGPARSIVAYAGICADQLTRIARDNTFINYNPGASMLAGGRGLITCCAHGSAYDPGEGCRVVRPPAPQPLTAIALEHDPTDDSLYAIGTMGGELFGEYFNAYRRELREEYGDGLAREEQSGDAPVMRLADYTKHQIFC